MLATILESFGLDANRGVMIINANVLHSLHVPPFPPTIDAVVLGVDDPLHFKQVMSANYPESHALQLFQNGSVSSITLSALSSEPVQAVLVPHRMHASFAEDFQEVIAQLRAPDGCPWDREQTHDSLRTFLLEEVHEFFDALDEANHVEIAEELGDEMLQLYLHAQIAVENNEFRLVDVFTMISEKMRRRHPHVFSTVDVNGDVGKVLTNWQEIKAQERESNGEETKKGALDGVSNSLPALLQAQHYQQRAILNGFHWDARKGGIAKVREEIEEVLTATTDENLAEEYGDLLFAFVSAISSDGFEAEVLLRAANKKFYQRFSRLEQKLALMDKKLPEMDEAEKIALWESIKET